MIGRGRGIKPGHIGKGCKAHPLARRHDFQALSNKRAVDPEERGHIRDCCESDKIQHRHQVRPGASPISQHGNSPFSRGSCASELRPCKAPQIVAASICAPSAATRSV